MLFSNIVSGGRAPWTHFGEVASGVRAGAVREEAGGLGTELLLSPG